METLSEKENNGLSKVKQDTGAPKANRSTPKYPHIERKGILSEQSLFHQIRQKFRTRNPRH